MSLSARIRDAALGRLNLRTKVTLLLLAISLTPLLLAGLVNVNRAVNNGKSAERKRYAQAAEHTARSLDGLFNRAHRAVSRLARRFPVESFDFAAAERALESSGLRPSVGAWRDPMSHTGAGANFATVFASLPDGRVFYAHPFHNIVAPPNVRHHGWFGDLGPNGGLAMGNLPPLTSLDRPALIAIAPIRDSNRTVLGYVGALMSSARLDEIVTSVVGDSSTDERALVLLDRNGRVAADTRQEEVGRPAPPELLSLRGVGTTEAELHGERVLVARRPVGQTGWLVQLLVPVDLAYRHVYGLIWMLTIVIVLTFVFVLLIADYLATVLLKPIRELENGAEMFGGGALDYRISLDHHGHDELGRLAAAFNRMGEQLEASQSDVQAYSRSLETANQELDAMVFAISHDLKKALRGIEAFATFIEEDYGGVLGTDGVEFVHSIARNVDSINALADDLIGLVEAEREGRMPTRFPMGDAVNEARTRALERRGGTGQVVVQPEMPVIHADRAQVVLLFDNLIDNGLKFNRSPNPLVEVSWADEGVFWRFEVTDNGIGIDAAQRDQVFELFTRLNAGTEFPGTGTGLNLARRIAVEQRGSLALRSTPGEGTTFVFHLPKEGGLLTSPGLRLSSLGEM